MATSIGRIAPSWSEAYAARHWPCYSVSPTHSELSRPGWLLIQLNVCATSFDPADGTIPIELAKSGVIQLWNTREHTARKNSRAVIKLKFERHVLGIARAAETDVQTIC